MRYLLIFNWRVQICPMPQFQPTLCAHPFWPWLRNQNVAQNDVLCIIFLLSRQLMQLHSCCIEKGNDGVSAQRAIDDSPSYCTSSGRLCIVNLFHIA